MDVELLNKAASLFTDNDVISLTDKSNEVKLLYAFAIYHYFAGDDDSLYDVSERCNYTLMNDNYAQGIFEEESYEEKIIDILVPYYVDDDKSFDYVETIQRLTSVNYLLQSISRNRYSLNGNHHLIVQYLDENDIKNAKIIIKCITNAELSYDEEEEIKAKVFAQQSSLKNVHFDIVFGNEIEQEYRSLTDDKSSVESSFLLLDKPNSYLDYDDGGSILCNIKASSLKANYIKYGLSGLFALNLRFYISDKKVDPEIEDTIRNHPFDFWYLNNGIIIICDDYKIDGDKLILKNFSIVNGGQTTRMVGTIPFKEDFCLTCKVIKNAYDSASSEYAIFVSNVAHASNNQKPIKSEDLIANRPEQRMLKQSLNEQHIFVSIKRGDTAAANLKENYPEPWQKTKNVEIAQLLYSGIYQKPGTARNSKETLFSNLNKYNLIFKNKNYNLDMIKDFLIFRSYYKKWVKTVGKDSNSDPTKKGLVKNGLFAFFASTMLLLKFLFSPELIEEIKSIGYSTERSAQLCGSLTFNHRLFSKSYELLERDMYQLFNIVYDNYIVEGFNAVRSYQPEIAYSNFLKTDKNYYSIGKFVYNSVAEYDKIPPTIIAIAKKMFYIENKNDSEESTRLFDMAKNAKPEEEETEYNPELDALIENLKALRSQIAANSKSKASSIFTNIELKNIALSKPTSIYELLQYGCFKSKPKTKTKFYGEKIVDVVNKTIKNGLQSK